MKKRMFFLLLMLATLTGRAQAIYEKKDDFTGSVLYYTYAQQPKLEGGSFFSQRYVYMKFLALKPMASPAQAYSIQVDASLQDWMFIQNGESLVLKVDGEAIPLRGLGSLGHRGVALVGGVQEVATWPFPLETLQKLAAAKTIQFRVYGSQGTLTGTFTDKMMADLRSFALQAPVMIGDSGKAASAGPKAGIHVTPLQTQLQVVLVDKGSPNEGLTGALIVAVEGSRGTGNELQAKLSSAISTHKDGAPISVVVVEENGQERETSVKLYIP